MSSPTGPRARTFRWLKLLIWAALVAWSIWCGWQLYQARRAGAALHAAWQRESVPSSGLSPSQQETAKRFLGRQPPLRQRLIAVATAAEKRQRDGGDVNAARAALAGVLQAAARGDQSSVLVQLDAAESALDRTMSAARWQTWPDGAPGVAARAAALEPAVRVGQELMTEGSAAAGRMIGRAAWHCRNEQYDEAAELLDLAAELMGVSPVPSSTRQVPAWFLGLAQAPQHTAVATRAQAAVELAEAVARAEAPGPAVMALVDKARRQFDAGQLAEADWWASIALAALAMEPEAEP